MSTTHEYSIALDQNKPREWLKLALVKLDEGRMEEVKVAALKAQDLAPSDKHVWHDAGVIFERVGDLDSAVSSYEKLIELDPNNSHGLVHLAIVMDGLGDRHHYIQYFERAIEQGPSNSDDWIQVGIYYMHENRPDEAENAFRRAIESDTRNGRAWNLLSRTLNSMNRFDEAVEILRERLEARPDDREALELLGFAATEIDDFETAEGAFRKSVELFPKDPSTWGILGGYLLRFTSNLQESESALRESIELDPENDIWFHDLGVALEKQGRLVEAEQAFEDYIRVDPDHCHGRIHLALLLRQLGRAEEGERLLREGIENSAKPAIVLEYLGRYLAADNRIDEAIDCLMQSVKIEQRSESLVELASHLMRRNKGADLKKATGHIQLAYELAPGDPDVLFTLSASLSMLEDWDRSLSMIDLAMKRGRRDWTRSHLGEITELFISATAVGKGAKVREVIVDNNAENLMEPFFLALKLELDEPIEQAPAEIMIAVNEIREMISMKRNSHGKS